jgi:hypothetical protein
LQTELSGLQRDLKNDDRAEYQRWHIDTDTAASTDANEASGAASEITEMGTTVSAWSSTSEASAISGVTGDSFASFRPYHGILWHGTCGIAQQHNFLNLVPLTHRAHCSNKILGAQGVRGAKLFVSRIDAIATNAGRESSQVSNPHNTHPQQSGYISSKRPSAKNEKRIRMRIQSASADIKSPRILLRHSASEWAGSELPEANGFALSLRSSLRCCCPF